MAIFGSDVVNIDLSVNGNSAVAELNKQQREIDQLTDKLKELKKARQEDSQQYKDLQNQLTKTTAKFEENRKELGLQGMTVSQLKKYYTDLSKELNTKLIPGTEAYIQKNEQFKTVKARHDELLASQKNVSKAQSEMTAGVQKGTSIWGSFKSTIGDFALKATAWFAAIFAIGKAIEFGTHVDELSRKFIKLRGTIQTITGASGKDLDEITAKVGGLAQQFDKDYNEVLRASNTLAQQYGISQTKALDLISQGFIKGADAQGDFLDKVAEYPAFFKRAGYSAEEFIKITTQEVKSGIYNDKLIDSIKETDLRLSELTKTQQDALKNAFGDKFTSDFVAKIKSGALTTKDAFALIGQQIDKSNLSMTQLQTLTADLGGGPTEDIGGIGKQWEIVNKALNATIEANTEYEKSVKAQLEADQALAKVQNEIAKEYADIAKSADLAKTTFLGFVYNGILVVIKGFNQFKEQAYAAIAPIIKSIYDFGKSLWESKSFTEVFQKIFLTAFQLITSAVRSFVDTAIGLTKILIAIYQNSSLIKGAFDVVIEAIVGIANVAKNLFDIIGAIFRLDFKGFSTGVYNLFADLGTSIVNIFKIASQAAVEYFLPIVAEQRKAQELLKKQQEEAKKDAEAAKAQRKKDLEDYYKNKEEEVKAAKEAIEKESAQKRQKDLEETEAAKKKAAELQKLSEDYAKKKAEAEKQLQDFLIETVKDGRNKELLQNEIVFQRQLQEIKKNGVMVKELTAAATEANRQKQFEINRKWDDTDLKAYTEQTQKQTEAAQKFADDLLLNLEAQDELTHNQRILDLQNQFLAEDEINAQRFEDLTLALDAESLAFEDMRRASFQRQLEVLQEAGKGQTTEAIKIATEINKIDQNRNKQAIDNEKKTLETRATLQRQFVDILGGIARLITGIFGQTADAQRAALIFESAAAIAEIVFNTQKSIAIFNASTAYLGLAAPAVQIPYATKAYVQAGLGIGTILATNIPKFINADKKAKGGYLTGPSHAQGGMRVEGTNIEVEGTEFIVNGLSTARSREAVEAINARPDISFMAVPKRSYADGGAIGSELRSSSPDNSNISIFNFEQKLDVLIMLNQEMLDFMRSNADLYRKVEMPLLETKQKFDEISKRQTENRS